MDPECLVTPQLQIHSPNPAQQRSTRAIAVFVKFVTWTSIIFRILGLAAFFNRILLIIAGGTVADRGTETMHVPPFYADENIPEWLLTGPVTIFAFFLGLVFGVIHCAGWDFFFPTKAEADIWRVSSALLALETALGILAALAELLHNKYTKCSVVKVVFYSLSVVVTALIPFYLLARVILLVEALILLRDLSPEALAVVEWTLFIPHLGT